MVVVAAQESQLVLSFHRFDYALGIAIRPGIIAVCTRKEVWFAPSAPVDLASLEPRGDYDACFLARTAHFTDDIQAHEAAWIGSDLWLVNTRFSCLATLHPTYSFAPRWRPPFVSALCPEDRCHLNGLAVVDGQPRYVSAFGETDSPQGWRGGKVTGGCFIDVPTGRTVIRGLALPHSPRVDGQQVYFLHSGHGRLDVANPLTGEVRAVAGLPGIARGLALHGGYAFVGLSKARPTLEGVPIVAQRDRLKCGLWVLNLRTGEPAAHLEFRTGADELFDIQVMPGIRFPYFSGPSADQEIGHPHWTIPPT